MARVPTLQEATAVVQTSSHAYTATLRPEWCIGAVPHGGYVTSLFQAVSREHFRTTLAGQRQPHAVTLHLEFLRRTAVGAATLTVQDVKLGRQTSTVHVSLAQGGRTAVVAYITHTDLAAEQGLSLDTKWRLEPAPLPVDLAKLDTDCDPNWALVRRVPFEKFRRASTHVDWVLPRPGPPAYNDGAAFADEWVRFNTRDAQGRRARFDDTALGYLSDMWPQLVEQHLNPVAYAPAASPAEVEEYQRSGRGGKHWYPTLLLNLEVKKALPPEGVEWLFARVRAKLMRRGRYDVEVVVLDAGGDVVALSHHVVFVLSAARNLAGRNAGSKDDKDKTPPKSKV